MVDPPVLRRRFEQCLGTQRYRKFASQVVSFAKEQGRLRYWAGAAWNQFVALNPDCDLDHASLCSVFFRCAVHDCEFVEMDVPIHHGGIVNMAPPPQYFQLKAELFPHHAPEFLQGEIEFTRGLPKTAKVACCVQCNAAYRDTILQKAE